MSRKQHVETIIAGSNVNTDSAFGAVVAPLHFTSTYAWEDPTKRPDFDYSRSLNPTRLALEETLAQLEGGVGACVTASGMAAITLVLALLKAGDRIVAPHDCYGGTYRLLNAKKEAGFFDVIFVDQNDEAALVSALSVPTKLVIIETPSNPLLRITDIQKVATLGKQAGALVCADNTFLSPLLQQPIALGCDIVFHSTTKFINGHSDIIGGVVIAATTQLHEQLSWWANAIGVKGAPFDAYQTLRGLRSLPVRLRQHQESTQQIVNYLSQHKQVTNVYYPGLETHQGHALAQQQQTGFGSLLSFEIGGGVAAAKALFSALSFITPAASLGGFETLICLPATMTHGGMSAAARAEAGISDGLIRLSVGLENAGDIIEDLSAGLTAAAQVNL